MQQLSRGSSKTPALSTLGRFYLPLGFTSVIMASSHWVISIGLTRTLQPEVALASYAVGMSTLALFENAAVMLRSSTVALVRSRDDARVVFRTALIVLAALVAAAAILSLTPALSWIYRSALRVSPELLQPAVFVFQLLLLLPLASGLRCFFQGLIIREQRTGFITFGMIVRLVVMVLAIAVLVRIRPYWGGAIGAITFLVGMCTEAIIAFWQGRKTRFWRSAAADELSTHAGITMRAVLTFLAPLLGTGMITNLGRMLLNAGLARESVSPDVLAAFSVGWSLVWVLAALVWGLHQTIQVFADRRAENAQAIRRFFVVVVLGSVAVISLMSFTPLAGVVLRRVMGTPENLVPGAIDTMRWLVLLPVVLAWHEWNIGHLLLQRRTKVLLVGKVMNVCLVALAVGPGFRILTGLGAGGGSVATLLGHAGEGIVLTVGSWWCRSREPKASEGAKTTAVG